jgi:hypothetical protein
MIDLKTEKFIQKAKLIHGDNYDYSKVDYINNKTKLEIICKIHGIFKQIPNSHLKGRGCPKCKNIMSKPEIEIQNYVRELGYEIDTNNRKLLRGKELDIYIPTLNKAIEFNGNYYHYSKKYFKKGKHSEKSNLCKQKGIKLLHIREDLWKNDQEKMKKIIIKFLNINGTR